MSILRKIGTKLPKVGGLLIELDTLRKQNEYLEEHDRKIEATVNIAQTERDKVYKGNLLLREEINFLNFNLEKMSRLHDEVVTRHWSGDAKRKELFCKSPFSRIEILENGDVYPCCSAHLKKGFSYGNIYEHTPEEIWNSENAKKLRYSVTMGNFEYCDSACMWLHNKNISEELSPLRFRKECNYHFESFHDCVLDYMPEEISLSCDPTCNLTCPSCRNQTIGLDSKKSTELYEKLMATVFPMLKNCKHLSALGSGEFFASSALNRFYQNLTNKQFPNLRLHFITNAQLFTEENFNRFPNLENFLIDISISLDSCNKETYEKIRRGASFEILTKNLSFIQSLHKENKIQTLGFNFLIQSQNYNEIEDFIVFSKKWGCDIITFQKITNWGTYDMKDFIENNVLHEKSPLKQDIEKNFKNIIEETYGVKIIQNIL